MGDNSCDWSFFRLLLLLILSKCELLTYPGSQAGLGLEDDWGGATLGVAGVHPGEENRVRASQTMGR